MSITYQTKMRGENNPNYRNAGHRICSICGNTFQSYDSRQKYCSQKCVGLSEKNLDKLKKMSLLPRRSRIKKGNRCICVKCNIIFYWPNKKTYCEACSPYGKMSIRTCVICKEDFYHIAGKKTCSKECLGKLKSVMQKGDLSHRWQGGKTNKVTKLRNSKEYANWRTSVFDRDNYTCQICYQRGGKLTSHHVKMASEYPDLILEKNNGITLCWGCHSEIRGKELDYEDLFADIINNLDEALEILGIEYYG